MALWAGIDEAGYGPLLGPLVVAGTAFHMRGVPKEGVLWRLLKDAVSRRFKTADGRLVVDDSKLVYTPARGVRPLEEGVLGFLSTLAPCPGAAGDLLRALLDPQSAVEDGSPWFAGTGRASLPVESHPSGVASKAAALTQAFAGARVQFAWARVCVVLPREFNYSVEATRNKSYLLFQKCGLLLQELWGMARSEDAYVLVDRHGGRTHYRKLLRDAFPHCGCDIVKEGAEGSVYRLSEGERTMLIAFKEKADSRALPVALASMLAKYVRELYMLAFNAYWQGRSEGLKPTAGYALDAKRFLREIAPIIRRDKLPLNALVRSR